MNDMESSTIPPPSSADDDDGMVLLEPLNNPDLAAKILGIRHNSAGVDGLQLRGVRGLDGRAWRRLGCILGKSFYVKTLAIDDCHLNVSELCVGLQNNRCIERLNLNNNNISDVDLDHLILSLKKNKNMNLLALINNRIGVRGCTSLAQLLGNRKSNLQYLYLNGNRINDESVVILAKSLAKNTKLQRLDLRGNN